VITKTALHLLVRFYRLEKQTTNYTNFTNCDYKNCLSSVGLFQSVGKLKLLIHPSPLINFRLIFQKFLNHLPKFFRIIKKHEMPESLSDFFKQGIFLFVIKRNEKIRNKIITDQTITIFTRCDFEIMDG